MIRLAPDHLRPRRAHRAPQCRRRAGAFALTLTPDPRLQVVQDADGTIRLTRAITEYGDDGVTPYVVTGPEYFIHPPLALDSNADPVSSVQAGPTTMTLLPAASGPRTVLVGVNPDWLHAPTRVFPVWVDVPIATAYSAANTGVIGTVDSCAPSVRAPLAPIVVGVEGRVATEASCPSIQRRCCPTPRSWPLDYACTRPIRWAPQGCGSTLMRRLLTCRRHSNQAWSTAPRVIPGATGIAQTGAWALADAGTSPAWCANGCATRTRTAALR